MTTFRVEFRSRYGVLLAAALVDAVDTEDAEDQAREQVPVNDNAIAHIRAVPCQVAA